MKKCIILFVLFFNIISTAFGEYKYIVTVGNDPDKYDYTTINRAILYVAKKSPDFQNTACIEIYDGAYVEQLNSFYPGGNNLPKYCDLIGRGKNPADVIIKHKRRAETDPNFTDIVSEIYAAGIKCEGFNKIENIKVLNEGSNQNTITSSGELTLNNCIILSYHDAVTATGNLIINDCQIEGWYRACVQPYSTFNITNTSIFPKTRSWGGEHPSGIEVHKSGIIDNVIITADIESSDYEPHYDTPWLVGVVLQLTNANDTVSIKNTTMDLTLTTLFNPDKLTETADWELFGIVNGGRNPNPTTYYPGKAVVENCTIKLNGIESSTEKGDGRAIMEAGICVQGGGTISVIGKTTIETSRKEASFAKEGFEYALINKNGVIAIDPNITYDSNLTSGTISIYTPPVEDAEEDSSKSAESGGETMLMMDGMSSEGSIYESTFYRCPELTDDNIVNFADFAVFANNWQKDGNDLDGDFDQDGSVALNDLVHFAFFWLQNVDANCTECGILNITARQYYSTIQSAIDDANSGDEIMISEGHYYENLNFHGKSLYLRSINPDDPNVVANTIVDGNDTNNTKKTITFESAGDANSVVDGLTITKGYYGIYCNNYAPDKIIRCNITANKLRGLSINNTRNYRTVPTEVTGCIISNNILSNSGDGINFNNSPLLVKNCVISGNKYSGIYMSGSPYSDIINCTVVGNGTYGIYGNTYLDVINCIVWNHTYDIGSTPVSRYSCIEDVTNGIKNISIDPLFVNSSGGDYHLKSWSQCIDAGDPVYDYSQEPNDGGGCINIGAYGNTPEAALVTDTDSDGIDDSWELYYWPNDNPSIHSATEDYDNDGIPNGAEFQLGWDPTVSNSGQFSNIVQNSITDMNYPSIQTAVMFAEDGDILRLNEGTYIETITFNGKAITICSTDPNNEQVVSNTIVNANNTSKDVASFVYGESANSVLEGLTLRGGRYGVYIKNNSSPIISKCKITANNSNAVYIETGSPLITRCKIVDNLLGDGIIAQSTCIIKNCIVAENNYNGIYLSGNGAYSQIINCTVTGHKTTGIIGSTNTIIKNSIIWDNVDNLSGCNANYSCLEQTADVPNGTGNFSLYPVFKNRVSRDYHLWHSSACVDTGDPAFDYSQEPNGGGSRINIGAYGNTSEAVVRTDSDSDGIADEWELLYWPAHHDSNEDGDSDGLRNKDEYQIGWDPNSDDSISISGIVTNQRTGFRYPSIDIATNLADTGDTLTISQGHYYENLNFHGKSMHLCGTDPNDPNIVASTIVDGNDTNNTKNTIKFESAGDANSIIEGLTITKGYYGIYCYNYAPDKIIKCNITANKYRGLYVNNTRNYRTVPTEVTGCIISNNILNNSGDGINSSYSPLIISNCVVFGNKYSGIYMSGSPYSDIINCTVVGNGTYGIYGSSYLDVINCIVWNHTYDIGSTPISRYSCIEDVTNGIGNISINPLFVNGAGGDYHLQVWSQCIDMGDPAFAYDLEPDGGGGCINIGAYGNTPEAAVVTDADSDGIDDSWELYYWPNDNPSLHSPTEDYDNDGIQNGAEFQLGWDPTASNSGQFSNIVQNGITDMNYPSIQTAVMFAEDGDILVLNEGTYTEVINLNGKAITVRSTDPNDEGVVSSTIVNAGNTSIDVVSFVYGEGSNSVIEGLTLRGGRYGVYVANNSSPTLSKCKITANANYAINVVLGSPLISRCKIVDNLNDGIFSGSACIIQNCIIAENNYNGIYLSGNGTYSQIINCTVAGHKTTGIIGSTNTIIKNSIIWDNVDNLSGCNANYSCLEQTADVPNGTGNFSLYPVFKNRTARDYHLWHSSACVDTGDPNSDWSNEPDNGGGRINIGAYGNTSEAVVRTDADSDGIADEWELLYWPVHHDPNNDDDSDGLRNKDEYQIGWDPNSDDSISISGIVTNQRTGFRYPSIDIATNLADTGDTLTISQGHYYENLNFHGKSLHLCGSDPNNPAVVAATIVDGNDTNNTKNTIKFESAGDANSIIEGLTITKGYYGIYCYNYAPDRIIKCNITANKSRGLYFNNTRNYRTIPTEITGCIVSNNILSNSGDGINSYYSPLIVRNCVIFGNKYSGIYMSVSTTSASDVINCTVVGNGTYGIYGSSLYLDVINCIVWNHTYDIGGTPVSRYSCIEDVTNGIGNISINPLFVNSAGGDYHLQSWSQCIDAGDPVYDYSQEPDSGGGRINIGAYGNTSEAAVVSDTDSDGIDDSWELYYWPGDNPSIHSATEDYDNDGIQNGAEFQLGWDPTVSNSGQFSNIVQNSITDMNYPSIQTAVMFAEDGDTLILNQGTYTEVIRFNGRPITIRGTDPNDGQVVANTIVNANNTNIDVASFEFGEGAGSILEGLTLRGGRYGVYVKNNSSPIISKCKITGNNSTAVYIETGAPLISRCKIVDNLLGDGIIAQSTCIIKNCIVAENNYNGISLSGNGVYSQIINCTVVGHKTKGISGSSNTVIRNSIIWDNVDNLYNCNADYSCLEQTADVPNGTGNFSLYPVFKNRTARDYHLWHSSACIDAGDPNSDWSGEPGDGGGRINIGAYGNTSEAVVRTDSDSDGIADEWELLYWPAHHDPNEDGDSDGLRNKDEYQIGWNPDSNDSASIYGIVTNQRTGLRYPTIDLATNLANSGDTLIIGQGTYKGCLNFHGKSLHLCGSDPNNPAVVAATIIDGNDTNNTRNTIVFESAGDANSVIEGLTITKGYYGIYCNQYAPDRIIKCNITSNKFRGLYFNNTRNYRTIPTEITGCIVSNNILSNSGDGINSYYSPLIVRNCMIFGNKYSGIYMSVSTTSASDVINCTVVGNGTYGIYGSSLYLDVINCIVWNHTYDIGGTPVSRYSCIEDVTSGTGNISSDPSFANIAMPAGQDGLWGNIDDGLRLISNSPCIDAADGSFASTKDLIDCNRLDVLEKANTGTGNPDYADIGAFEFGDNDRDDMYDAWEVQFGLDPNNPADAGTDMDDDGLTNLQEYQYQTYPDSNDTDSDYMLDKWEIDNNFDPKDSSDASEDADQDGLNNLGEHNAGTDPYDRDSDNDEMDDNWEVTNGLDPANADAPGDLDNDGFLNFTEYLHGSDPNSHDNSIDNTNIEVPAKTSSIQLAIDYSIDGDMIVIQPGIYYENLDCKGREITLTGIDPNSWGVVASTIIDANSADANAIVCKSGETANTVLKGLKLVNGKYGLSCENSSGPSIINSIISDCNSHGIYISSGAPSIQNSIIEYNYGSGIYSSSASSVTVKNNWIYRNANGIESNSAASASIIRNNTIVYNDSNGITVTSGAAPVISNCILWSNNNDLDGCTATYSCIEDADAGMGNISSEPNFVDSEFDDYHLLIDSLCINAGDPLGTYTSEIDIDGDNRLIAVADIGADEYYFGIWYVNSNVQDSNEYGTSWDQAFSSLQSALASAEKGDYIWVAAGTYYPDSGTNRAASFVLTEGVSLYGGFDGNEISIYDRDWYANPTVLSGDIGTISNITDNSYHVVAGANDVAIDGFIVMSGNADGSGANNSGGGIYNSGVSPIIRNCSILGNYANYGGGILNVNSMAQITNCIFSGNYSDYDGGGIYNSQSPISLINCTFSENIADSNGAAVYNYNSSPSIINTIIWGNDPNQLSIYNSGSNEPYISFSDIQHSGGSGSWDTDYGIDDGNNIDNAPLFYDANGIDNVAGTIDDDVSLTTNSPCIGSGLEGENMGADLPVDSTSLADPCSITNPVDIAVGTDGDVYVLSSSQSGVYIFDEDLNWQSTINISATNPMGLTLDTSGRIYIADTGGDRILRYTSGGSLDTSFDSDGIVGQTGTGDGQFNAPWGIAVDFDGNVYVSDSGNDRIQIFNPNGQFVSKWGQSGTANGQLNAPAGIFYVSGGISGDLYVADGGNNRIQKLSASSGYCYGVTGKLGSYGGQFNLPTDICYDFNYDQVIVADANNDRLQILNYSNGSFALAKEIYAPDFNNPTAMVCANDPDNAEQIIYVADTDNERVLKLKIQNDIVGTSPSHIFTAMKSALKNNDIEKAVSFFDVSVRDDYRSIFNNAQTTDIQSMANDIGSMTLSIEIGNLRVYEISAGGYLYPVEFVNDGNGNWKIMKF